MDDISTERVVLSYENSDRVLRVIELPKPCSAENPTIPSHTVKVIFTGPSVQLLNPACGMCSRLNASHLKKLAIPPKQKKED
jgi:hypothetical protein